MNLVDFIKVDCTAKKDLAPIVEGSTDSWGDHFTIGVKYNGTQPLTKIDFVVNGTLKQRENRAPWHIQGDYVSVNFADGPISCVATLWNDRLRLGTYSLHFTVGPTVQPRLSIPGVVTQTSFPEYNYIKIANSAGERRRYWCGINSWDKLPAAKDFTKFLGRINTLCFTTPVVPTPQQSLKFFTAVRAQLEAISSPTRQFHVEVGNEPNLKKFFAGTVDQYINCVLAPAWQAMGDSGKIKVVGGAPSENLVYLKSLVSRGYKELCHRAAFHPYQRTVAKHIDVSKSARDIVGDFPLDATEWNAHLDMGGSSLEEWADLIPVMYEGVKGIYDMQHYYRISVSGEYAGKAGLWDAAYNNPTIFLRNFNEIEP